MVSVGILSKWPEPGNDVAFQSLYCPGSYINPCQLHVSDEE